MISQQDMIVCALKQEPCKLQDKANVWCVCIKHKQYILVYYLGCVNVSSSGRELLPKAITLFPVITQSKWLVWCTSVSIISARAAEICFLFGFTGLQLLVVLSWVWAAF